MENVSKCVLTSCLLTFIFDSHKISNTNRTSNDEFEFGFFFWNIFGEVEYVFETGWMMWAKVWLFIYMIVCCLSSKHLHPFVMYVAHDKKFKKNKIGSL
jgi:hypothetical protein